VENRIAGRGQVYWRFGPLVPVPRLTAREVRALGLIELGWPGPMLGDERIATRVLRGLIRQRCIQVMAVSPARYRVTKLGKVARSLGVRS
jgi:hypothetical protein